MMVPLINTLFDELQPDLSRVNQFDKADEATVKQIFITFEEDTYHILKIERYLYKQAKDDAFFHLKLEPLYEVHSLFEQVKSDHCTPYKVAIKHVCVIPKGYTVTSESSYRENACKLQKLINDYFRDLSKQEPIVPQGCLKRGNRRLSNPDKHE